MKISFSAMTKYSDCSYSYFLHYMLKLRTVKEGSALKFGGAMDLALNELLLTKDVVRARHVFATEWIKYTKDGTIKYSKADLDTSLLHEEMLKTTVDMQSWFSLSEKANIMLEEYAVQILPKIKQVISVQFDEVVPNGAGDFLSIKPDLICEWIDRTILLVDNKTSSVTYETDSVRISEQLSTYYDALKEKYGLQKAAFIVIPKRINRRKKPAIDIKVIIDEVQEEVIEETYAKYQTTLDKIKAAEFHKDFDKCIGKYGKCCYYNYCRTGSKEGLIEKES